MATPVAVHPQQRSIHMLGEAVGVFFMVPFLIYASRALPTERGRSAALTMAASALIVDGFLLVRYLSETTSKPVL